jgi:hypothetical protein
MGILVDHLHRLFVILQIVPPVVKIRPGTKISRS